MSAVVFLDTNILIYAAEMTSKAPNKRERARKIIADGDFGTSTQVAQEFYVNVTPPKAAHPIPYAQQLVERLMEYPCIVVDKDIVVRAMTMAQRYQVSYWDAAILAAALALGATVVYSEDFNHNQDYGGVRVINPFV